MAIVTYGSDTLAKSLFANLTMGQDFSVPLVDLADPAYLAPSETDNPLYDVLPAVTEAALTTREPEGSGMFDGLMEALSKHLHLEYEGGRISSDQYSATYIQLTQVAMQAAVQFLLGKDASRQQALLIQAQGRAAEIAAVRERVNLETARAQYQTARGQAAGASAVYAATLAKLPVEDASYGLAVAQRDLVVEQMESHRAKTLDTRSDGQAVAGTMLQQRLLHEEQITSYRRDAETKLLKQMMDAWITHMSIDGAAGPPTVMGDANITTVFNALKGNLEL